MDGVHGADRDGAVALLGASAARPACSWASSPAIPPHPIPGHLYRGEKQPPAPEHAGGSLAGWPEQAEGPEEGAGLCQGKLSPEQMMKAGVFPRRALVLLKQSRSRRLLQVSTTSHHTGKWLPRSGLT